MSSQSQSQTQNQTRTQATTITDPSSTSQSPSFFQSRDNPPDYDTLSLAPPSITQQPSSSSPSTSKSPSLRQKLAALKAEDERRKAERITHVSAEEADRITGLDRHRAEEERKSAERRRGGKSVLGMLMIG